MPKSDFIHLLKDCDLLIIPQKKAVEEGGAADKKKGGKDDDKGGKGGDAKKEEEKEPELQFDEADAEKVIANAHSFEDDQLAYVDFLEAIVRVATSYPFKEDQLADMPTFEHRMMFFIQAMENKFNKLKEVFS